MTLAILQPLALTLDAARSSAGSGLANLATPNPREAFVAAGTAATIIVDLGSVQAFDTVLLGFTNAAATDRIAVAPGLDAEAVAGSFAHSFRRAPVLRHGLAMLPAPVRSRYLRLQVKTAAPLVAGIVVVGEALRPNHDWNAGRPIIDTGRVERLLGGGFGKDRGVAAGGWQWVMPDLSPDLSERLYALALDVGLAGELLVIEDPAVTPALNERIHWSLFGKFEPFERQPDGTAKWAMQVQDWA